MGTEPSKEAAEALAQVMYAEPGNDPERKIAIAGLAAALPIERNRWEQEVRERLEQAAVNHEFNTDKAEGIRLALRLLKDPGADAPSQSDTPSVPRSDFPASIAKALDDEAQFRYERAEKLREEGDPGNSAGFMDARAGALQRLAEVCRGERCPECNAPAKDADGGCMRCGEALVGQEAE